MIDLRISEDGNDVWTVHVPNLIVTNLTFEEAEDFVDAYLRVLSL